MEKPGSGGTPSGAQADSGNTSVLETRLDDVPGNHARGELAGGRGVGTGTQLGDGADSRNGSDGNASGRSSCNWKKRKRRQGKVQNAFAMCLRN